MDDASTTNIIETLRRECERLRAGNVRLRAVELATRDLLLSADYRNEGQDWPEACERARRALAALENKE